MELLCFSRVIDQCGSYMQVNTPVLVKGRLSVRDEKPPRSCATPCIPWKAACRLRRRSRPPTDSAGEHHLSPLPQRRQPRLPAYQAGDDHV